jgi:hypothetical protein
VSAAVRQHSRDDLILIERRLKAYHESGHAVGLFLIGQAAEIEYISMQPNDKFMAFVEQRVSLDLAEIIALARSRVPRIRQRFRRLARQRIFVSLTGPAAEYRLMCLDCPAVSKCDWMPKLGEHTQLWEYPGGDYHQALWMARAVGHTTETLKWTAGRALELMAMPRVWQTVAALAKSLRFADQISGDDARQIMSEAYGADEGIPLRSLGVRWARLFVDIKKER